MEDVIKKWELILRKDSDRNIAYGRKVLEEMLIDVKKAVKKVNKKCNKPIDEKCIKLHGGCCRDLNCEYWY